MTLIGRYSRPTFVRRQRTVEVVGWLMLAGLLAGMLAKWMDEDGPAVLGSAGGWLAWLLSLLGVWAFTIAMVARSAPSPSHAAVRSSAFLLAMCVGYYGFSQVVFGFSGVRLLELWCVLAVTVAPLLATGLCWAVRSPRRSAAAEVVTALVAAIPLGVLVAEAVSLAAPPANGDVPALVDLVLAAVLVWLLPRNPPARMRMLLAGVPTTLAAWLVQANYPHLFTALLRIL
jgi:hypothetical protein